MVKWDSRPRTSYGLVEFASHRGSTLTCREVREAVKYSEHKMYKKIPLQTNIGKLKIMPMNGVEFYAKRFVGGGVKFELPTEDDPKPKTV